MNMPLLVSRMNRILFVQRLYLIYFWTYSCIILMDCCMRIPLLWFSLHKIKWYGLSDILRVRSCLLTSRTMIIPWTCGALGVCSQEWYDSTEKFNGIWSISFNQFWHVQTSLQIFRKEPFFYGHDNHDQLVKIAKVMWNLCGQYYLNWNVFGGWVKFGSWLLRSFLNKENKHVAILLKAVIFVVLTSVVILWSCFQAWPWWVQLFFVSLG